MGLFRAKNSNNVYFYIKKAIDYNPPAVSVTQNGSTLTATSTATDLPAAPDWRKSSSQDSSPTCANLAANQWSRGSSISNARDGKYYCFRVTDNAGNHGYGSILVNLTASIITITQDQDSVDATANTAGSRWSQTTPTTTDQTCSTSTSYGTVGASKNTVSITSADNNKYVCFRFENAQGVYSYKK